jgi:hypothetical protein
VTSYGNSQLACVTDYNGSVIAGHSRPKDGVASLAHARKRRDPAIHERAQLKTVFT